MSNHEKLRHYILKSQRCYPSGDLEYQIGALAEKFTIDDLEVQEVMIGMKIDGLIAMRAYDGQTVRDFQDWPNAKAFFYSTVNGGNFRVRVLACGAELRAELPKAKVGFV